MTAPLSGAFKGYSYKGAFGNDMQSVADMAAGLARGRIAEEERKRQAALEAAMQRMKEEQLGLDRQQVDQGSQRIQLDRDRMAADAASEERRLKQAGFEAQMQQIADDLKRGSAEEQAGLDRASAEKIAGINAKARTDVAGMRQVGSGRDFVTLQDSAGGYWRLNKLTNQLDPIRVPTQADLTNASTDAPAPAAGPQLTGAGARPSQSEMTARSSYDNLEDAYNQLENQMASVAFAAPNIGEQLLIDGTKSHMLGPLSSLIRSGSNTILGNVNPAQQKIQHSAKVLGNMVVKMQTGAQMADAEAQRILQMLETIAGDPPDLAQQKLATVKQIIQNERQKVGRADTQVWRTGTAASPPEQGFNGQMVDRGAAIKAKYGLE